MGLPKRPIAKRSDIPSWHQVVQIVGEHGWLRYYTVSKAGMPRVYSMRVGP